MANRLEELLTATRGRRRGPCRRTVAMGRWNCRNAVSFLLDHFDELRPDVVVYVHLPERAVGHGHRVGERAPRGLPGPGLGGPVALLRVDRNDRLRRGSSSP